MAQPRIAKGQQSRQQEPERRDNSRLWKAFKIAAGVLWAADMLLNNGAVSASIVGLFSEEAGHVVGGIGRLATGGTTTLLQAVGALLSGLADYDRRLSP